MQSIPSFERNGRIFSNRNVGYVEIDHLLVLRFSFSCCNLQEFWLDKSWGGFCMSISSKALLITGIDDRRYWNYIPTEESRYHLNFGDMTAI